MLATIHTILGFASLIFGAIVLYRPKGTPAHVFVGRTYAVSMVGLCLTSFGMFELFGGFGIFHFAAIISLVSVSAGVGAARLRRKLGSWIHWHYQFMAWSYLGLLGATSNEAFVHIEPLRALAQKNQFIPLITLAVLFIGGGVYINAAMNKTVRRVTDRSTI